MAKKSKKNRKYAKAGEPKRFAEEMVNSNTNECVEWPFARNSKGYGRLYVDGKIWVTHRWVCVQAHGKPPADRPFAAHTCGNSRCVTKRHLRWASAKENSADLAIHGTRYQGDGHCYAVLTAAKVRFIRKSSLSDAVLGKRFGVMAETIRLARIGENWKHVDTPPNTRPSRREKLCLNDVLEIRARKLTPNELALKFSVSTTTIYDVLNNRTWKHAQ